MGPFKDSIIHIMGFEGFSFWMVVYGSPAGIPDLGSWSQHWNLYISALEAKELGQSSSDLGHSSVEV